MTVVPPSRVLRLGRLLRPGQNSLARDVDRVEGVVVGLSVLLALVLVPVMLTLGSVAYAGLAEESGRQVDARHETAAILTEDAPAVTYVASGEILSGASNVPARWRLPDGTARTGVVPADDGLKAGAEVPVWLDESGRPVDAPMSTADAVMSGVLVAAVGWLGAVGLLALACWGLHRVFNRRRYRAWASEWAVVGEDWRYRRR